jgi:two-component system cell cycle response regulator
VRVLVADDDVFSRRILRRTLERGGFEVVEVSDGRLAADLLRPPDGPRLALLDWMMPKMDGPEVCREVRRQRKQPYVHLVLLTSRNTKQDIVDGLESGADDYLTKPFHPAELNARLKAGLRILELEDCLVEAREEMRYKATHDHLTSLFNRGVILELMAGELVRTLRQDRCTTVIMADVDHFKNVNDTYGHPVGDEVLQEVARRLLQSCRSYDFVGRYGGEEFLIVLNDCEMVHALSRAEELRRAISGTAFRTSAGPISITISLGVYASRDSSLTPPEDVLREVDAAMYASKSAGRNAVRMAHISAPVSQYPPELAAVSVS